MYVCVCVCNIRSQVQVQLLCSRHRIYLFFLNEAYTHALIQIGKIRARIKCAFVKIGAKNGMRCKATGGSRDFERFFMIFKRKFHEIV